MARIKVKICGLTTVEAVETAVAYGADYLGFVFETSSPRYFDIGKLDAITANVPPHIQKVAVCRNPASELLHMLATSPHIDIVQIHGDIPPSTHLQDYSVKFWKACHPPFDRIVYDPRFAAILMDGATPGGGQNTDWSMYPHLPYTEKFIAGGLDISNIRAIIEKIRPYGIDLSSGVESSRGIKSCQKIRDFLNFVHALEF